MASLIAASNVRKSALRTRRAVSGVLLVLRKGPLDE